VFDAGGCGGPECQPLWRGNAGTYVESSPAVADGRVFIGAGDAELKVFDASGCGHASCDPLWVGFPAGPLATIESAPMVANGVVYVGENNKRVYAYRAGGCGNYVCGPLWEHITDDPIVNSSPVMVNGTLYVTGSNFGITPILYSFGLPGSAQEDGGR
jgi:outer membrane protein assembly factor BamB